MNARIMFVIAASAIIGTGAVVAQDEFTPKIGDNVTITLRDSEAGEFIRTRMTTAPKNSAFQDAVFVFQSIATITQILPDGQFVLEHTSAVVAKEGVTRMLTVSATIDPRDEKTPITVRQSPAGTLVYTSPADRNPTATRTKTTTVEIDLSKAKIALRTWVLAEEMKFNQ